MVAEPFKTYYYLGYGVMKMYANVIIKSFWYLFYGLKIAVIIGKWQVKLEFDTILYW